MSQLNAKKHFMVIHNIQKIVHVDNTLIALLFVKIRGCS